MIDNWHHRVYGKVVYMTKADKARWQDTRARILKRDKFTCQRCNKHYKTSSGLSVHHILPRAEGGQDDDINLVALCHKCHDYVELEGYRTLDAIINSFQDAIDDKPAKYIDREETFTRPDWHKYVYGGQKRNKTP